MELGDICWHFYPHVVQCPHAKRWIEILVLLQKAPKTVDAYARGLNDFLWVCERLAISVVTAGRGDIAQYLNELAHRSPAKPPAHRKTSSLQGLSNATMHQRLTVIRLFYDYLIDCGLRTTNPVGRGHYTPGAGYYSPQPRAILKRTEQQPWIPGDDAWYHFLEVVFREESVRNQLMVLLSYDGALRRQELLLLTPFDIDLPHRQVTIRPEYAKNGAGRVVFFSEMTSLLYLKYLHERRRLLARVDGTPTGRLFVSESHRNPGQPITVDSWNKAMHRMAQHAGLPQLHPHTFRHLRLTHFARHQLET